MTEPEHQVRDGERTLQFDGDLLAESSSYRPRQTRWIEFKLYRTTAGSYVLSRIGNSIVYHASDCALVSQYRLKSGPIAANATPCDQCAPDRGEFDLFPERIRYWAQVMTEPVAILEALMKYDYQGARYLTLVAQRLLEQASDRDERVKAAYRVEHVA